jgi:hypothetical protein
MREGLRAGLAIDLSTELEAELTSPMYGHNGSDQIALEKKDAIKKRLGISPDDADALALTYAMPVMKSQYSNYSGAGASNNGLESDYDPYAEA